MADKVSLHDVSERMLFAAPAGLPAAPGADTRPPAAVAAWARAGPKSRLAARFRRPGEASSPALAIGTRIAAAAGTELDRRAAFCLIPVLMAVGAIGWFQAGEPPSLLQLASAAAGLALLALTSRSLPAGRLALSALLTVVAGAMAANLETRRAATRMTGSEVTTQLMGRVATVDHMANGRVRLTIAVSGTARPVLKHAPERVRVTARRIGADILPGTEIEGLVRLMPPRGPVRPGGYDFCFQSYFDGIGASGFFLRGPVPAARQGDAGPTARFEAALERWRGSVARRIRERIGGGEGEIAAALVVGVRAGIPEEVNEALRRAGIYHIISISGLHMALVAGTIMGLLRGGFALFPGFSSRHPVKKYAAGLAIAGIASYLFISGAEVAARRSFIMLAVMLTAVLFDRAALTMRNLAISAIVVIAASPHEVVGPSFQMSFAATAALVGAYAAWAEYRLRRPRGAAARRSTLQMLAGKAWGGATGLAVTSLVAGGATSIYAAYHFQQVSPLGLFTNLAAMPIVSTLVMPFAVLGTLAMPFGLDGPLFDVMGLGLSATVGIARWFSERSPFDAVGPVSPLAVSLLTLALVVAAVCTTWLRAAAIPLAVAGLLALPGRAPDLLISEDGRLLGLGNDRSGLAVDRPRPNQFLSENWQPAVRAAELLKPQAADTDTGGVPALLRWSDSQTGFARGSFVCSETACVARHASGAVVVRAADEAVAAEACTLASVIVIEDATARDPCRPGESLVVTTRDLARLGSAAVTFVAATSGGGSPVDGVSGKPWARIDHAIQLPYRPWHQHRHHSRAARGLAPYRSTRTAPAAGTGPAAVDGRGEADQ